MLLYLVDDFEWNSYWALGGGGMCPLFSTIYFFISVLFLPPCYLFFFPIQWEESRSLTSYAWYTWKDDRLKDLMEKKRQITFTFLTARVENLHCKQRAWGVLLCAFNPQASSLSTGVGRHWQPPAGVCLLPLLLGCLTWCSLLTCEMGRFAWST